MPDLQKLEKYSVEELLRELRARESKQKAAVHGIVAAADLAPDEALQEFDSAPILKALQDRQKVIYGTDNRLDVFQVTDPAIINDADSVVALFQAPSVVDNGNGTSTLLTQNFGTSQNLCAGERFRNQPVGAFCSGFLVAPDIIATAGHCVNSTNVTTVRFVFGFRMLNATNAQTIVNNSEIYRGVAIIGRQLTTNGTDWSLVRIDRAVTNHRIVQIRRVGSIANNQALHVIGHPVGLPTKVAAGAAVRDNSPAAFFVSNLDTYGGNSGSPVFNANTHEVEGILVRGETDFVSNGTCNVSLVCPSTGCRGEDCTRTTEFAQLVERGPLLHLSGVSSDGRLWHTIRFAAGPWTPFGDVEAQTGDRGSIVDVDLQSVGNAVHLCAINSAGNLWHTIRRPDRSWLPFGDVEGQAGARGSFARVGVAEVNGELHVCGVTTAGRLWHTIRRVNGSWFSFGDVETQTGDRGSFTDVDCAGSNGELHVCGTTSDGRLWHTIRRANGTWAPFGDIEAQAGNRGMIREVACAIVAGELHVCCVSSDGRLWHTIRRANGTWLSFGDVESQTGDRGSFVRVSAGDSGGELHVAGVTSNGRLWHTIRRANGTWFPFGDVEAQTGDRGNFRTVSVDGLLIS
jgi:hypothetical protein